MRDSNCQVSGSRLRNLVEKVSVLVSTSIFILVLLSGQSKPIFQKAVISIILTIESSMPSILFLFWTRCYLRPSFFLSPVALFCLNTLILFLLICPMSDSPLAKQKNVTRGKSFGLLMFSIVSAVSLDSLVTLS
jgi:hypothetical protein